MKFDTLVEYILEQISSRKLIGPFVLAKVEGNNITVNRRDDVPLNLTLSSNIKDSLKVGYNYAFEMNEGIVDKVVLLTVDIVVHTGDKVLLIRRKNEPWKGSWALPGGFIDAGESPLKPAKRELKEETGLIKDDLKSLGEIKTPNRDPRMENVWTYPFAVKIDSTEEVHAGDDASDAKWISFADLDSLSLAADHRDIINRVA